MSIKQLCLAAVLAALVSVVTVSQSAEPKTEMTTYVLGLLHKGEAWSAEVTEESKRIQAEHLDHIMRRALAGDFLLAGPLLDDVELRGILIIDRTTVEEAEALVRTDPAVKARRLRVELHPWYGPVSLRNVFPAKTQ